MDRAQLVADYPTLYHMAEDGTWPSIRTRGLLSTKALVDLYQPAPELRTEILGCVRRKSITLDNPALGPAVIRDQGPLKFIDCRMLPGTSPEQFLDALNGRVFFWLTMERLVRLVGAVRYRRQPQIVLQVSTAELMSRYGDQVELAPLNTGSMHVPTAPARGVEVFVRVDEYPYEQWRAKRGPRADAVVELTVPYAIPDIAEMTTRVERWIDRRSTEVLFQRAALNDPA